MASATLRRSTRSPRTSRPARTCCCARSSRPTPSPSTEHRAILFWFAMKHQFRQAMARLEDDHWWFRARRDILDSAVERFVGTTDLALTVGVVIAREAEMRAKGNRL